MTLAIKRVHNLPPHLSYVSTLTDVTQKPKGCLPLNTVSGSSRQEHRSAYAATENATIPITGVMATQQSASESRRLSHLGLDAGERLQDAGSRH